MFASASRADVADMDPLVSVLITAYNAEAWIAETLASVDAQTYSNIEVIVVDDGSVDGTADVVRSFGSSNVRLIVQENGGACAARNRALSESQGDLIQYLDADDLLSADKIALQVDRLGHEPDGTVASGPWVRFTGTPPPQEERPDRTDWRDYAPAAEWLVSSWAIENGMFAPFAWLTPRALVDVAGPWNEQLQRNQDGEFFARVLSRAAKIAFCPNAWGFYRSGLVGSVSRRRGRSIMASLFAATELCAAHVGGLGDSPDIRRAQAALWERYLFEAYPVDRALARIAEQRARALGGAGLQPEGGRAFQILRDAIGWKPAVRLQQVWYGLRYT